MGDQQTSDRQTGEQRMSDRQRGGRQTGGEWTSDRQTHDERAGRILVAGVGNDWMRDDGFGGTVVRRLEQQELSEGVVVMDVGTGGLDLAYEVMRGYDALVIVDVSRQGGEPGTLYVMEADEQSVEGSIEDGELVNPHSMDPQTVLRFVRSIGAWPGRVIVIACEPAHVEEMGLGLSDRVESAVQRAVDLVGETIGELRAGLAPGSAGG